ncbi:MAG: hypothetical protein KBG15_09145 [Kofleriaceae bacterium]|nr:hypothetical protein [Kofleriaceae bacterium]
MGSRFHRIASAWWQLHELADFSDADPRWWLIAIAAGLARPNQRADARYLASNGAPASDTFIAVIGAGPYLVSTRAAAVARAAQQTLRALHGRFEQQPLASWVQRSSAGDVNMIANPLREVAFAIGNCTWVAQLSDAPDARQDQTINNELAAIISADQHGAPHRDRTATTLLTPLGPQHRPFITIVVGPSPYQDLRHLHRRGWHAGGGPFIGIGVYEDWMVCSTCHIAVDGYGHTLIARQLAQAITSATMPPPERALPALPPMATTVPLGVAWRRHKAPAPRALQISFATGMALQRRLPEQVVTMQVPVAIPRNGRHGRVVPALLRYRAETFAQFAERGQRAIAATRSNASLMTGLMNFAQAAPVPRNWQRNSVATPPQFALARPIATALAGRACISLIRLAPEDRSDGPPIGPMIAVSAPALTANRHDPAGGIVVTVIDDGIHATTTVCGSGLAGNNADANEIIDEIEQQLGSLVDCG